jgi:hypothetical protein
VKCERVGERARESERERERANVNMRLKMRREKPFPTLQFLLQSSHHRKRGNSERDDKYDVHIQ